MTDHVLAVEEWVAVPPVREHDPGVRALVALGDGAVGEVGDGVLLEEEDVVRVQPDRGERLRAQPLPPAPPRRQVLQPHHRPAAARLRFRFRFRDTLDVAFSLWHRGPWVYEEY